MEKRIRGIREKVTTQESIERLKTLLLIAKQDNDTTRMKRIQMIIDRLEKEKKKPKS